MNTGPLDLDLLLSALVLSSLFAMGAMAHASLAGLFIHGEELAGCVGRALRASDFLLHSRRGLAVERGGLVLDHVVRCERLHDVFPTLGVAYARCGPYEEGRRGSMTVKRKAVWRGRVVDVEVSVCGG